MKKIMLGLALMTSLGATPAWALDPPGGSYDPPVTGGYPPPPPRCFRVLDRVFCVDLPLE